MMLMVITNFKFNAQTKDINQKKKLIVIMFDGFGMSYYNTAKMPFLKKAVKTGLMKEVKGLMPSVTNLNNASICSGTFPEENGIVGNSFLNPETGKEDYMENKELLMTPTLFQKLKKYNIKSALISSKKKSIYVLPEGADIILSAEIVDSSWIKRLGKAPSIYSSDINYWSMEAALYILKNQKDIGCLYIHTTDYPMHMWPPNDSNMTSYLSKMDEYIKQLTIAEPNAIIMITADHDLNHKGLGVDIEKSLAKQNIKIKTAISAEKDKYPKHHGGLGGTSYVYLDSSFDAKKVTSALLKIKGVKTVLSRDEAAKKFHLMASRIGDLVVLADSNTVFGIIEESSERILADNYRSHGSEYETKVPLIIFNSPKLPSANYFNYNMDITRWLFEDKYKNIIIREN